MAPMRVDVEGVSYDYKRFVLEVMECLTCGAVFLTHVASGMGQLQTPKEETLLCSGCEEICRNLEIGEESGAKPS